MRCCWATPKASPFGVSREADYADGGPRMFLRRVWAQCFPAEPIPGGPDGPFDALLTVTYIYFASPDDAEDNYGHRGQLRRQLAGPEQDVSPLLRAIKPDLAKVIVGDIGDQPANLLRREATYTDADDQAFARRMWAYLFPVDPTPGEEAAGPAGERADLTPLPDLPLDQPALR